MLTSAVHAAMAEAAIDLCSGSALPFAGGDMSTASLHGHLPVAVFKQIALGCTGAWLEWMPMVGRVWAASSRREAAAAHVNSKHSRRAQVYLIARPGRFAY